MEFRAAPTTTATLTKKHSNGYGFSGRSAYDGVFATPIKLRAPSFTSQFDDYREIFGSSGASSGSSIPILELPEINERRTVDDVRRSKLDYSMVFGGFENLDAAVPFEELVAKPKERSSFNYGASTRKKVKSGEQSRREDHTKFSKEFPVVSHASNDAKKISMSYHKVNQGCENGTNGTTHIAQLHAVPAYTCLIEEVNSMKKNRVEKTIPVTQDTYSGSHFFEGIKEGGSHTESVTDPSLDNAKKQSSNNGVKEGERRTKSFTDPSPDNAKKQSSNNGVKANNRSDSIDLFYEISSESNRTQQVKEGRHRSKSFTDPPPDSAKKQSSNNGVKTTNRSDSIDLFYDAFEISNGSNGTHQTEIPPSEIKAVNLDNHNVDTFRSMSTKCQASRSDAHEGAAGADSPTYMDDMIGSNSATAASVAALRKAIEDAQVRMKVAKESMRRKKEGFPDCVKQKSNIELKAREKKETILAYKTTKPEKINARQTFIEMGDLLQISSEVGKPTMRIEQVRSDLGAKEMCVAEEPVQEAQKKLNFSRAEHKEEVELRKADHRGKNLELKDATNTEKVPYNRNTGRSASLEPEESDHTIEMVRKYCERENDEEKVHADNTSVAYEELAHETKHNWSHVIVDETELIQETLNNGFKVNENGKVESTVAPFNEPEDYESNLGGQGLVTGNKGKVGCKPEEDGRQVEGSIELEEHQRNLKAFQELGEGEKNIPQEQKESDNEVEVFSELEECELTEFLDPIDNEGVCNPHRPDLTSMEKGIDDLGCLEDPERRNESDFLDLNQEVKHSCWREATDIYMQEILADIVDHIHDDDDDDDDDDGNFARNTMGNELDGDVMVQDAQTSDRELEGATQLMQENDCGTKDNKVVLETIMEGQTDPNYKEIQANEFDNTTNPSTTFEPDETDKLSESQVADTIIESEETQVAPEVSSCDVQDDIMIKSCASIQHQEKYEEPEYVQETNDFCELHPGETSAFDDGAPELNETVNQMKHTVEAVIFEDAATYIGETDMKVIFEDAATNIGEPDMKVRQSQHQCLENAESDYDQAMLVEETITESAEICKDAKESRIASDEEADESRSNSSKEEVLLDNELNIGASQVPSMSEWKSSLFKEEEVKSIRSNGNGKPPKVELDKERVKKIDEAKERKREREREREKLAVERAIREARERAFADAKERAALERAASEARQKNISDGRERLGKATSQANEKTPAERAALEAKLKAERAAVERATAEARARALSRALSEKAASDARNKSDKSIGEKNLGASRDNRTKHNFHSKSFSYSEVHYSTDLFDEDNGDSAQRCKARSERHQRIGERVAKALAEKNMRDRLVQKEQEEKNRVAEALDADVKRWSSGKTGNLRALLSTLQYILRPDSGWQPIPLTDIVTSTAVKKAYRKATLCVHPDKLQQRGASVQQKYICEKVFDLLKEAWNRFNAEER